MFLSELQHELSGLREEAASSEQTNKDSASVPLSYPPSAFANLTKAQIRASGNFAQLGCAFVDQVEAAKLSAWKRAQKKLARCDFKDEAMNASKLAREHRVTEVSKDDVEHLNLDITDEEQFLATLRAEFSSFGHEDNEADAPTNLEMTHARTGKPINYPPSQFAYLSEERIRASRNFELHGFKFLRQVQDAKLRAWKRAQAKLARNNAKEEVKAASRAAREAKRAARLEREAGVRQRQAERDAKRVTKETEQQKKKAALAEKRGEGATYMLPRTADQPSNVFKVKVAPIKLNLSRGLAFERKASQKAATRIGRCQK